MNLKRAIATLGGALALTFSLALTPAHAQVGNHNCSEGSINEPTGDIIIFDTTGGCALGSLNAGGQITITSNGPVSISGAVTAVGDINVSATGALQTGAGQLSSSAGSILLFADTTITVNGATNSAGGLAIYSGNGGNIHVVGTVTGGTGSSVSIVSDIVGSGTVTVDSSITAGLVEIRSNGNIQVTGALNSQTVGGHVDIKTTASGGTIKLDGAVTAPGQVVELVAFGNISTKTIDTSSTNTGIYQNDVRIIANKAATGAIPAFVIGGTGNSNGVNGSIIANTATSDNQYPQATRHNVAIVNGGSAATGGITIVNGSNISVASTTSRAGCILIDAKNGPFILQAGTLSANGATGQSAGCIAIAADAVTFGTGTIIRANDNGTKGFNHYVAVAARQLGVTGTVNMQADGKGISTSFPGSVLLLAKGSFSWTVPEDYFTAIQPPTRTEQATQLTVNGSGSLVLRANGAINRVEVVAKPITFSNTGTLTITANGASPNVVRIKNPGSNSNVTGLSFTGGNVTVRSDGVSGVGDASGGYIEIFGDQMTLNANTHTFSANGPSTGNGNGGRFYFASSAATLKSTGKVTVTANAASTGTGNAILGDITTADPKAIQFFPGSVNVDVGTASGVGQYSFSAKGGSTGGNGGTVYMSASTMTLKTANAINAAAIASGANNGDGGEIYLNNYISVDPAATVTAIGKGTGQGGKFTAFYFNPSKGLDVNTVIKVDGGATLPVANFHGSIKLNDVTCRQWKTAYNWPKSFWKCNNGDAPNSSEKILSDAGFALSGSLKTLLGTHTPLYVFNRAQDHNIFFDHHSDDVVEPEAGGNTFSKTGFSNIYVSVFLRCQDCGSPGENILNSDKLSENSAHELGHSVDFTKGIPNESGSANYIAYIWQDFLKLDYAAVGADKASSTPRDPCLPSLDPFGNTIPGPFYGVTKDDAGTPICIGFIIDPNYAGMSNSQIMFTLEPDLIPSSGGWIEPYARAFSFQHFINNGQYFIPVTNGVFHNGYFACINAYADTVLGGSSPHPVYCGQATPNWYLPNGDL